MGNAGAKFFGLPEAFVAIEDSVAGLLKRVSSLLEHTLIMNVLICAK